MWNNVIGDNIGRAIRNKTILFGVMICLIAMVAYANQHGIDVVKQ